MDVRLQRGNAARPLGAVEVWDAFSVPARRSEDLGIASLQRRLAASLIDGAVFVSAIGAFVIAGVSVTLYTRSWRARRRGGGRRRANRGARVASAMREPGWSATWRRVFWVLTLLAAVGGRNWRGPGARLLRIRRVDARTGGPIGIRSALIGFLVTAAWRELNSRFYRLEPEEEEDRQARLQALKPELDKLRDSDPAADPDARRQFEEMARANTRNCLGTVARRLPGHFALELPALWSPRHQSISDRLAGIVTVVDP